MADGAMEQIGMAEFLNTIIGWPQIVDTGMDAVVYFAIGAVASGLFVVRLIMMLFGAEDGDVDLAHDGLLDGGDADHLGSGAAFNLFSLLSILAFLMGVGWMGLTARLTWELGTTVSLLIALGSGVAMMLLASSLMAYVKRLEHLTGYDVKSTVGHTGRVYLTVPGFGKGTGQVEINVSGRRKIINARTQGSDIAAFASVKVVGVGDDGTLVVEVI
jgi:hypothetical protein